MLTRIDLRGHGGDVADRLPRPPTPADGPVDAVREILAAVNERGDDALRELTRRFDGVEPDSIAVPVEEMAAALDAVPPPVRDALEAAAVSIQAYHEAQLPPGVDLARDGVRIQGRHLPVDRAGCYVPGGRAVYPSTVLMTAIPAQVAGVAEVVLCVPPGPDGRVPDVTLAAAAVA
nr:histidinol dehydrogenase [Actinomycetota bacterium]NIS37347.1 histidinol dehydrogenase [Actinomycetota bacterium]NIT99230.1 histidinol dehydrogenase [Actinomycetota bacterium]NIU22831.1 histidinol dehydrogenase [Actinomycetota bacterium]NIU71779.1 histidinol dehydrogenase [Actinomycetota bacterium]